MRQGLGHKARLLQRAVPCFSPFNISWESYVPQLNWQVINPVVYLNKAFLLSQWVLGGEIDLAAWIPMTL